MKVCMNCLHDEPHDQQRGFCRRSNCKCDAPRYVQPEGPPWKEVLLVAETFCMPDHLLPGTCSGIVTLRACCNCRDAARAALILLDRHRRAE